MSISKIELQYNGYKVVSKHSSITFDMALILEYIERYSEVKKKQIKVVFFNYDEYGNDSGVSFFYRRENGNTQDTTIKHDLV